MSTAWAQRPFDYRGRPSSLRLWFAYPASHERDHAQDVLLWQAATSK